ncbi:MAG: 4-hydroxy-tetrahydrodipicolinate reductase [Bacteroidales bacterium]|nr:4-hydroxy-tetrahydrodipicolinate reductase [Bacteroidales bacterium]
MKNVSKKSLNIALLGYGKMGKEIEHFAVEAGHQIVLTIDNESDWEKKGNILAKADVAIDFSLPKTAVSNIEKCFALNVPIVIGTTGWYADFDRISELCKKNNKSLFYATNFSLGVNIFSAINKKLAEIMNRFPDYDLNLSETHHTQKLDAPSGTAISLAEGILDSVERKTEWKLDKGNQEFPSNVLLIKAYRIENVPGTHEITYLSDFDEIKIIHEAKSRKGFAKGALLAAEWIYNKKGIFSMNDLLTLMLNKI